MTDGRARLCGEEGGVTEVVLDLALAVVAPGAGGRGGAGSHLGGDGGDQTTMSSAPPAWGRRCPLQPRWQESFMRLHESGEDGRRSATMAGSQGFRSQGARD
jgi:hypothetical protein